MELLLTRVAKWCLIVAALVVLASGCGDDEVPGKTTTEPSAVKVAGRG